MPGEAEFHQLIGIGMNSIRMVQVHGRAYWPIKIQERIDVKNSGNRVQSTFERPGQNAWNIIKFEQGYVQKGEIHVVFTRRPNTLLSREGTIRLAVVRSNPRFSAIS